MYEAVVYEATMSGKARFAMPEDLSRFGVAMPDMALDRAELRFGISDPRGLFGQPPGVSVAGTPLVVKRGGRDRKSAGVGKGVAGTGNAGGGQIKIKKEHKQ